MDKRKDIDIDSVRKGAKDFRYLLGRRYPREKSLELVGNRYALKKTEREFLHRGVFAKEEALRRKEKLVTSKDIQAARLAVDGHNVLITVEAGLSHKPLVAADDGLVRDISGASSAYRAGRVTIRAVDIIMEVLQGAHPKETFFLFDAPMSKSGRLAAYVAERLRLAGLNGEARAVKVPEKILISYDGYIATSDSAIIDRVEKVVDLAGEVIREAIPHPRFIRL
jgi:hypothetical protein